MTLHWWMHWFWVTLLLFPLLSSHITAAPQSEELQHITPDLETRHGDRQGRAMYYTKTIQYTTKPTPLNSTDKPNTNQTTTNNTIPLVAQNVSTIKSSNDSTPFINDTVAHPAVQWTPINVSDANISTTSVKENEPNLTTPSPIANVTSDAPNTTRRKNLTRPDLVKDDANVDGAPESRIVTEKPLSLETSFLQTRVPPNIEPSRRVIDSRRGMDTGAIAGISFAALVLAALAGSTAFVLYRRRYLNKPQTLNDKCSNPDSSGYLDDSTIRDNSEEMYSLDNDSFLNSLEAMTIQNYWTDTVKHTKL